MIAIVDYETGNFTAIANIYRRLNIPAVVTRSPEELRRAHKVILPGVGAFDWAMTRLNNSGLRETLDEIVRKRHTPVLGICVGMQMLAVRSEEGTLEGLGWVEGDVKRFDVSTFAQRTHLPHMGWNNVRPVQKDGLFAGLDDHARFYFLHSYYFAPSHEASVLAVTDYNGTFVSGVRVENVLGVQFHPEKSHQWGIRLLQNFAEL